MSLFGQPGFCLTLAWVLLSKNKFFQSGTLLKVPTSPPSMADFCRDIQKYTSFLLKFPKITKTHFSDFRDSLEHIDSFFSKHQGLLNVLRNFSVTNFSYTNGLHFLVLIRVHFDKNLIYSKVQAPIIMVK